jgi:hypothetical protein
MPAGHYRKTRNKKEERGRRKKEEGLRFGDIG